MCNTRKKNKEQKREVNAKWRTNDYKKKKKKKKQQLQLQQSQPKPHIFLGTKHITAQPKQKQKQKKKPKLTEEISLTSSTKTHETADILSLSRKYTHGFSRSRNIFPHSHTRTPRNRLSRVMVVVVQRSLLN